jgi:hypothetical protein
MNENRFPPGYVPLTHHELGNYEGAPRHSNGKGKGDGRPKRSDQGKGRPRDGRSMHSGGGHGANGHSGGGHSGGYTNGHSGGHSNGRSRNGGRPPQRRHGSRDRIEQAEGGAVDAPRRAEAASDEFGSGEE